MEEAERRALAEVEEVRLRDEVEEAVGKERNRKVFCSNRGRSHFVFFLLR